MQNVICFRIDDRLIHGQVAAVWTKHLHQTRIVVIDEISPDTCRLLDIESGRCLDKDRFRKDMGEVSETYDEVSQRVLKLRKK